MNSIAIYYKILKIIWNDVLNVLKLNNDKLTRNILVPKNFKQMNYWFTQTQVMAWLT